MKKFECEHDAVRFTAAIQDGLGHVVIKIACADCPMDWEYIILESDFISAMDDLDPDPNIFINGVLQNED